MEIISMIYTSNSHRDANNWVQSSKWDDWNELFSKILVGNNHQVCIIFDSGAIHAIMAGLFVYEKYVPVSTK